MPLIRLGVIQNTFFSKGERLEIVPTLYNHWTESHLMSECAVCSPGPPECLILPLAATYPSVQVSPLCPLHHLNISYVASIFTCLR